MENDRYTFICKYLYHSDEMLNNNKNIQNIVQFNSIQISRPISNFEFEF